MTDPNMTEEHEELFERMEEEGFRVLALSGGGYVVVDLACPPCFAECSNIDELLKYCAENLVEDMGPTDKSVLADLFCDPEEHPHMDGEKRD